MKLFIQSASVALFAFAIVQAIRPGIPARPASAEVQAPPEIRNILEKDCYSCHSDERRLSWFDEIVPAYWLVRHDVLTARQHLNFSTLGSKPPAAQRATLFEAANMIQLGAMPLPQFVQLHPEAKVTPEELTALKDYLAPWASLAQPPAAPPAANSAPADLAVIKPELNGLPFDATFEGWKLISATDRGDNNTFRFILGNDIAMKAAASGNISPWPDGTRFAKIAWQQTPGSDGLVRPGGFIQVELMVKDAQRYKQTEGWGWGRWRGLDLKPYGNDPDFVGECTGCHKPVRGDDYVYTIPITAAASNREEAVNNRAAGPVKNPLPLSWQPITLYVDPKARTLSVLFGNDAAVSAAAARTAQTGVSPKYPDHATLELVTWAERDDPHWFGARIPDAPISLEMLQVGPDVEGSIYQRFDGAGLPEHSIPSPLAAQRTAFMLSLNPAQLP
jgi:hypothetical protein